MNEYVGNREIKTNKKAKKKIQIIRSRFVELFPYQNTNKRIKFAEIQHFIYMVSKREVQNETKVKIK
jgi:hypothetical protein